MPPKRGNTPEPAKVPLPGLIDGDIEVDADRGSCKRAADAGDGPESPHRKTRAQSVVVDLAALKTLLADQSASLLEQNRAAMQEMMGDLKKEIRQGDEEIKATLAVQTTQITELQDHKVEVLRRLEALEARQGAAQTSHLVTDSASLDRHKSTLVFGGWPRETPKAVIISETHSAHHSILRHPLTSRHGLRDLGGVCAS